MEKLTFEEKLKQTRKIEASRKAKLWAKQNPDKYAHNLLKANLRAKRLRKEAQEAYKMTPHKTMHKAIKAFCNQCPNGKSRSGFNYAPVECSNTECPLFCFRNFDAVQLGKSDRAKKMRNARKAKISVPE